MIKRKLLSALVAIPMALAVVFTGGTAVKASEGNNYDFTKFGGLISENYIVHDADSESAIAVGGDFINNGYYSLPGAALGTLWDGTGTAVGDPYDFSGPSMIVGGQVTEGNLQVHAGPIIVSNEADKDKLTKFNFPVEVQSSNSIKQEINSMMAQAVSRAEAKKNNPKSVVYNVDSNIGAIDLSDIIDTENWSADNTLVMYNDSKEINFQMGGAILDNGFVLDWAQLRPAAKKIIWYFPNAEKVSITAFAVPGSVIAPNAIIDTHSGNINGQLVAKQLNQKGGFELHNMYFDPGTEEPDEPETPPVDPEKPTEPDVPVDPEEPTIPEKPVDPDPETPVEPEQPTDPDEPEQPIPPVTEPEEPPVIVPPTPDVPVEPPKEDTEEPKDPEEPPVVEPEPETPIVPPVVDEPQIPTIVEKEEVKEVASAPVKTGDMSQIGLGMISLLGSAIVLMRTKK